MKGKTLFALFILVHSLVHAQTYPDQNYLDASNYYQIGDFANATKSIKRSITKFPDKKEGYAVLGLILAYDNQYKDSEKAFNQALQLDSIYFEALFNFGMLRLIEKKYDASTQLFLKAAFHCPDNSRKAATLNQAANAQNFYEQYSTAIPIFKEAIRTDPSYVDSYNGLANAFLQSESKDSAIYYYQKAIDIDPNYKMANYNLAIIHFFDKNYYVALPYSNRSIEIAPNDGNMYFLRAQIYYYLNDKTKYKKDLKKAEELGVITDQWKQTNK